MGILSKKWVVIIQNFSYVSCKKEPIEDGRKLFVECSEYLFDYFKTEGKISITNISGGLNEIDISFDTTYLNFPALMWQLKNGELDFRIKRQNITSEVVDTKVLISSSLTTYVDTVSILIYGYTGSNLLLDHNVVDAEYCTAINRILYVSDTPDFRLYSYDPLTSTTVFVPLSQQPKCISVATDGAYCAIGYDFLVSRVNISAMTIEKEMIVSGPVSVCVYKQNRNKTLCGWKS